ncbi:hypothetical protein C1M55_12165 [Rhodococcus qingshengii]|uniref:hypothetical protein n=1 Tax=Rhodococcus sp. D-1 TaxID=1912238 RepID=UPI000976EB84|nr:hypothetical protein [Rhodococcus sp. D-1]AUS31723.1 hypothetical protein C1M55_11800 [Rhodococcus qingshengii]AUS31788.1 hypothetical protein C1M55_12165 [Rhodococcus qingshengii]OMQ36689.1 hypothetical protein BK799_08825 [Rhodococcus sp. D-1]
MIFPGSAREMVAFPPAPMFVVPIDAAASGAGTATAVLVTTPVYPMNIVGDGTASVTVSGVAVFMAAVSGVGEALAVFAQLIEAPVSGVGTASVVVKPSISLAASVSSSGTPAVVVKPVAPIIAAVTCEGIAGVGAWPAATMTAPVSGSGTATAAATARSVIAAIASGSGTATAAVTAVTFQPSGMTKNASAQTVTSTATQIAGMVAESGSTLSGNSLLPNGSKTGATITAQVSITDVNFSPSSVVVELRKNGVLIPGATLTANTVSGTAKLYTIPTVTANVTGTDQYSLWVTVASGISGITVTAGANTYVRIT